jgi:DNA invertase Pin-like site-specific DNA recombinase
MNTNRQTTKITVLYERLSRDDLIQGESLSIANQMQILETYAEQNGYKPYLHLSDDGHSGVQWDRLGWQELLAMVERGEVGAILVKTMDRMGRDYLRMGLYREMFKERGIRLIAVSEGFDSFTSEDDFTPFKEIMAEWFARDTSKKIKAVAHAKGNAGKPLSYNAIYGYRKSPDDKNVWLTDDEAAQVVRRIFQMAQDGMGAYQIAKRLCADKVEKPSAYFARTKGWAFDGKGNAPYAWNGGTVRNILSKPEYCGKTVNFRTYKDSFKSKKFKYRDKSEWKVFDGTHSEIIDGQTYETVQKLLGTPRRPSDCGEANPLTGLLFCADCGRKMYNSRTKATHYTERRLGKEYTHKAADFYTCSMYSLSKGVFDEKCSQHYIRTEVVRRLALTAIQNVCGYVRGNQDGFIAKIREESAIQQDEAAKAGKRKLAQNQKRVAELDRLFKKTYEDNASGKLSDRRFEQLAADYEREQADLEAQNETLTAEIAAFNEAGEKSARFIELVRRYTEFDELTTPMLNAFIDRIVVHEADKSSGERVQDIDVHFNFIGKFAPPREECIPTEEEIAAAEKRRARLAKQREANRRWYAKKREEERRRQASLNGEIMPPAPEKIEAAEQGRIASERAKQAGREKREAERREYKREYARQDRANKSAAIAATV